MQVYVLFKVCFLSELLPTSMALKPFYIEVKSIVVSFQRVLEEVRFATTWLLADKLVLRVALAFDLPGWICVLSLLKNLPSLVALLLALLLVHFYENFAL